MADSMEPALRLYFKQTIDGWKRRENDRRGALEKLVGQLEEGRKKLEIEEAKIKSLKSKLRALGSSRSTKELVRFLVGYSKDVSSKVKELHEAEEGS